MAARLNDKQIRMFRNPQLASAPEEFPQANVGKQYSLVTEKGCGATEHELLNMMLSVQGTNTPRQHAFLTSILSLKIYIRKLSCTLSV